VPTGDITEVTAGTGLTGGGTTGAVTLNIDSTVATLTGTQTLTNKSLDATQLTGTLANAVFPAVLPAVSGANLTGIPTPTLTSLGIANHDQVTVTAGGAVSATSFAGDGSSLTGIQAGAGYFDGNNGAAGDTTNGKGDIFRVHSQTLTSNVTIGATDNALAVGPLTVDSSVTLTVNGNLTVV
jgi:hypothetical protein